MVDKRTNVKRLKRSLLGLCGKYGDFTGDQLRLQLVKSGFFSDLQIADAYLHGLEDKGRNYSDEKGYSDYRALKIRFSHSFDSVKYYRVDVVEQG